MAICVSFVSCVYQQPSIELMVFAIVTCSMSNRISLLLSLRTFVHIFGILLMEEILLTS